MYSTVYCYASYIMPSYIVCMFMEVRKTNRIPYKLQVIFRKRATNYRALLQKMIYKDKASHGSLPPCTRVRKTRWMSLSVAVCCSVLQCVAVCCSVLQCVAVCCSVPCLCVLQRVACCSVLRVAVCCSNKDPLDLVSSCVAGVL